LRVPSIPANATSVGVDPMVYYFLKMNAILAFWIAYTLTRLLGASLGDLLSQPMASGGLGQYIPIEV
jgi:uncharacterized membrane-anchored protein